MALEAERWLVGACNTLQGAVKQRYMGNARCLRQRSGIDRETVVLAGDQHLSRVLVEHRMIRAVVAELHLERAAAAREAQQLMAKADAECRRFAVDDLADRVD